MDLGFIGYLLRPAFLVDIRGSSSLGFDSLFFIAASGDVRLGGWPLVLFSLVGYMASKAELQKVSIFLDFMTYLHRLL